MSMQQSDHNEAQSTPMIGLGETLTDVKECNREAIHLISSVQARGCILLFSCPDQRVHNASANVKDVLGSSHEEVLGARIAHLLPQALVAQVEQKLSTYPWNSNGRYFEQRNDGHIYRAYLFYSAGLFGLEIEKLQEPQSPSPENRQLIDETVTEFLVEVKAAKDVRQLADVVCRAFRKVTDIDRVMLYKFHCPSWHGDVIGEDRVMGSHSFMGHRFPSSDIPLPARQLYLRNKVRVISDVFGEDSPVLPATNHLTGKPLDLSDSRLRSVSKVHLEYLRNMGVKASISFAIVSKGELWGLIACHHMSPFNLTQAQRSACEIIAETAAISAPLLDVLEGYRGRFSFEVRLKKLLEKTDRRDGLVAQLMRKHLELTDIFDAQGVAIFHGGITEFAGITPKPAGIKELADCIIPLLEQRAITHIVITNLTQDFPHLAAVDRGFAGVLAVRFAKNSLLMLFRPELIRTITWGGDPKKSLEKKNFQGNLNPRESFATWEEVVRGTSKDWSPFEIEGAKTLADIISENMSDIGDAHP